VAKEAVPVERVRMGKEKVTDEVTVSEDVRKEQIDADGVYPEGQTSKTDERARK
jgi:stress response protein YsnF